MKLVQGVVRRDGEPLGYWTWCVLGQVVEAPDEARGWAAAAVHDSAAELARRGQSYSLHLGEIGVLVVRSALGRVRFVATTPPNTEPDIRAAVAELWAEPLEVTEDYRWPPLAQDLTDEDLDEDEPTDEDLEALFGVPGE